LAQVGERLRSAYEGRANGYENPGQFRDDVALIASSLRANKGVNAGLFYVERLLRRIDTFGFHLATLDVRQRARVMHEVVADGFDDPGWLSRSSRERRDRLAEALEKDRGPVTELDALGKRTLAVFDAIMQGRHRYGPEAVGYFIVSDARGADDVLAALLLARWAEAYDKRTGEVALDIAPQFESAQALSECGRTLQELLADPLYRRHLDARGRRQCVLIGYSDSNKETGACASRVIIHQAQHELAQVLTEAGEQAQFYQYFQAVTPIDVIERMQIGSRPVHRLEGAGLETLLPVPWVFAWSQTRYMLPGWYGAGTGLRAATTKFGLPRLREAYGS